MTSDQELLRANSDSYEWLVKQARAVDRRKRPDEALARVKAAAVFASRFHPGRFADGAVESIPHAIGKELPITSRLASPDTAPLRTRTLRRVLHVTPLITLGGHSPLIQQWISSDRTSSHSVVLINQPGQVPPVWRERVDQAGGRVFVLPPEPYTSKAIRLREIARSNADVVVWHVIDPDVVPVAAFAVPECPPVVIVDHCDHQFWLGSSVADLLVNLRTVGLEETAHRRFIREAAVLPIPLAPAVSERSREECRRALRVPNERVVLLTVARGIKFRPCGPFDFVATLGLILERNECADAYVVGETFDGIAPYLRGSVHPRLRFVGPLQEPALTEYRRAADVYLETFPYGSQTALLEAAASGLPIVPAYGSLAPMLVANDDAIHDLLTHPATRDEYVASACELIASADDRATLGRVLQESVVREHVGEGWLSRLARLYQFTDKYVHSPAAIPVSQCEQTPVDCGLARWGALTHLRDASALWPEHPSAAALGHSCDVAKFAGDFGTARSLAFRCLARAPGYSASWRLLAAALFGPARRMMQAKSHM